MKNITLSSIVLAVSLSAPASADVFISEYIEGSSNNKAIEIYNAGISTISLDGYTVAIYNNGGADANSTLNLTGSLASGSTFVIGHSQAAAGITSVAQLTVTLNFNGDDTLILRDANGNNIDVFGQYLFDPGSQWSENGVTTQNSTLRRVPGVLVGDPLETDAFDPSAEWLALPIDTFDGLGQHSTDGTDPNPDPDPDPDPEPGDGELIDPCVNCPDLSPVADPTMFEEAAFYANITTAIAQLSVEPSTEELASVKALINDAAQANQVNLTYSQVWSALTATDEDPSNNDNVILWYSGRSISKRSNGTGNASNDPDNWNREHSWPSSKGFGDRSQTAYTDIHHLRPTDISVNSTRGNKDFDLGGNEIDEALGNFTDADSFEPRDDVKGDVARMMFYMDTRYEGETGENVPDLSLLDRLTSGDENALGKLCVLIDWHNNDPVDNAERDRHDSIYQYQGNRNPYIDNPQWVDVIYPEATCDQVVDPVDPIDPIDPPIDPIDPIDPVDPPSGDIAPLFITAVFDGTLSGGIPKGVELFVTEDIADLSICGIGSANNGGGSDGQEFTFPAQAASAGDFIYVASEATGFNTYFGRDPDFTSGAMAINGDDAIELFCNSEVVDLYGDVNSNSSGDVWNYRDGFAKRVNGTAASPEFNPDNWVFSGRDVLDGQSDGSAINIGSFEFTLKQVFFSEYVEGSGFNKALELVNVTGREIDLSDYMIQGFQNGNTSAQYTISLEGVMLDQSVFVLATTDAAAQVLPFDGILQISDDIQFNGDDAVVLSNSQGIVDVIGQVGFDPGSQWGSGLVSTRDNTIRRKLTVTTGDTDPSDAFDPSIEWDGFANNTLDDLGVYAGFDNGEDLVIGQCADPATLMSEVQGEGDVTPLSGEMVVVEGVVTLAADGLSGFFIQEEASDQDGNENTSEALFVFANGIETLPNAGDVVRVMGEAREFNDKTQITAQEISASCGIDSVVPVDFVLPLSDGQSLEAIENMLVSNPNDLFVTSNFSYARFGELVVSSERLYSPTHLHLPGSPEAVALADENARNEIILDDLLNGSYNPLTIFGELSPSNNMRTGSIISSADFVMDYAFNAFRLRPASNVNYIPAPRPDVPEVNGNVKVASFNVLNLFNGDGMGEGFPTSRGADNADEYELQLSKIVEAMFELDASVYGLMEIENDGFDATSSIAQLVDALNSRYGSDTFAYVDAGEAQGTDVITVGIIYDTNVVTPAGALGVLDSSNSIEDADGPLFDDSRNRPSFAQLFSVNATGDTFVVNVNHLRSKGGSCGAGDDDFDNDQGACNLTRTRAAQALHVWLANTFVDQPIVIVGDLNAYAQEDPLITLSMAGYVDLALDINGPQSYSYTFRSRFGSLDYILANTNARELVTGVAQWHINSDEPVVFDYNDTLPNSNLAKPLTYIEDSAFRSSDHDPIIVGLDFPEDFMLGDVNGNGRLDFGDYFGIYFIRGTAAGDARFNPAADMNEDGRITRTDLSLWFSEYRKSRRGSSLFF